MRVEKGRCMRERAYGKVINILNYLHPTKKCSDGDYQGGVVRMGNTKLNNKPG